MPTHGSLTKAGKVRNQTPKIKPIQKKNPSPRKRNIRNFQRMLSGKRNFRRKKK